MFRLIEAGKCALCTSAFAHEEAVRNIQKKVPDKLVELTTLRQQIDILPEPHPQWVTRAGQLPLARKDAPVLAAALQGKVDIFVTGDRRDFGHLFGQIWEGVKILSPADIVGEPAHGDHGTLAVGQQIEQVVEGSDILFPYQGLDVFLNIGLENLVQNADFLLRCIVVDESRKPPEDEISGQQHLTIRSHLGIFGKGERHQSYRQLPAGKTFLQVLVHLGGG